MVRAPCCEKMGLKKGPWTPDEDQVLVNYIKLYGHGNWRALPRQAGLLRCGKSCRLRWTNYLRPDIKRGNFTIEEEETIIKLHEMLGNRWSTIAARLPGRTDNEIKNVWHTHLKKRLRQNYANPPEIRSYNNAGDIHAGRGEEEPPRPFKFTSLECMQNTASTSPPHCSSESSSVVTAENATNVSNRNGDFSRNNFPEADENFWLEVLENDQMAGMGSLPGFGSEAEGQFGSTTMEPVHGMSSHVPEALDFWYNIFARGGELPELKEIL